MSLSRDRDDDDLLRRFATLIADSRSGVWLKRDDGRFLAVSPFFASEIGLPAGDVRGARDRDLIPQAEVERFRADDRRVIESRRARVVLEPPDRLTPQAWSATLKVPLLGSDGAVVATLGVGQPLPALVSLERLTDWEGAAGQAEGLLWPDRVRRLLDQGFRRTIRVGDLARLVMRHPDHVARTFRSRFGCSIAEYVRARRIAWSCDHLARTVEPLVEVALDAGFCDQSHLTRAFGQVLSSTPARYRRQRSQRRGNDSPLFEEAAALLTAAAR